MKKILLSIFLAAAAATAHADWVRIAPSLQDPALYADRSAADKSVPNRIKLWNIIDYAAAQEHDGKLYRSARVNYEYDCDRGLFRELIRVLHKEPMGNGVTVYWTHGLWNWGVGPGSWNQPEAGSVEAALLSGSCAG